jgi:hypothetical protein
MVRVFANPHAEIFDISDEVPHTVFAYWKGFLQEGENEATYACQYSLDFFKEAGIKVMISDHSYLEGATLPFLDWIHDHYFPTAADNGLIAEIVLDAKELLGTVSLDLMYNEQDVKAKLGNRELLTPKSDTLENAKKLAAEIIAKYS